MAFFPFTIVSRRAVLPTNIHIYWGMISKYVFCVTYWSWLLGMPYVWMSGVIIHSWRNVLPSKFGYGWIAKIHFIVLRQAIDQTCSVSLISDSELGPCSTSTADEGDTFHFEVGQGSLNLCRFGVLDRTQKTNGVTPEVQQVHRCFWGQS